MHNKTTRLAQLGLLATAMIWGSGFIGSQMALDANFSSAFIMLCRFAIATMVFGVASFRTLRRQMTLSHWKYGLIIGSFLFFAFYVQTVGLQYTTPSKNAFITAANVVIVPFLWWLVRKKRPTLRLVLCSLSCLVGIGILSLTPAEGFALNLGDLLTLGCAVLFACQIVATGVLAEKIPPQVVVFMQFAVATGWSLVLFVLTDRDLSSFGNLGGMLSVVYLGLFSTCLCYFLQTMAQKYVPSSRAAILLSFESLFGTLFSVLLGYDDPTLTMLIGGAVIVTSTILADTEEVQQVEQELEKNQVSLEKAE